MARREEEEFNWLDDPFDEKKAAREQQQGGMTGTAKVAVGCGCLVAVVGIVMLFIFAGASLMGIMADL